jgi:hypothetical protein
MYSLSFLIVELETARTKLLDVFEVSNGTPQGLGTQPFPDGPCGRTGRSSSAFPHALAFAKRMNRSLTAGDCAECGRDAN